MSHPVEYYAALKGIHFGERAGAADKVMRIAKVKLTSSQKALKQERAEKLKQSAAAAVAAKVCIRFDVILIQSRPQHATQKRTSSVCTP